MLQIRVAPDWLRRQHLRCTLFLSQPLLACQAPLRVTRAQSRRGAEGSGEEALSHMLPSLCQTKQTLKNRCLLVLNINNVFQVSLVLVFMVGVIVYKLLVYRPLASNPSTRARAQQIANVTGAFVNLTIIMILSRVGTPWSLLFASSW